MSGDVYFSTLRPSQVPRGMVMVELYGPDRMTDVQVIEIPAEVMEAVLAGARVSGRCLRCELLARLAAGRPDEHRDVHRGQLTCSM